MNIKELAQAIRNTRMYIGQSEDGSQWTLTTPALWSDGPSRLLAADPTGTPHEWDHESTVDLPNCTAAFFQFDRPKKVLDHVTSNVTGQEGSKILLDKPQTGA